MAKTVIIAGLFCKNDERTAGADDADSDGGALTSEVVVNMILVLPESFTTTGVESGGKVVGVEDVTVVEEGSEEPAAGELVEEVLLVASDLVDERVEELAAGELVEEVVVAVVVVAPRVADDDGADDGVCEFVELRDGLGETPPAVDVTFCDVPPLAPLVVWVLA